MSRARPIVFGNWKMNGLRAVGLELARAVAARTAGEAGTLGIFPPATLVAEIAAALTGSHLLVGGQDCHAAVSGAFTGSIAAPMLHDAGAAAVILGHSERRHGLGESSAQVRGKVEAALLAGLLAVVCIGETEAQWQAGERDAVLTDQLAQSLPDAADPAALMVAYEPVWAIGTGRTPTLDDIAGAHGLIRGTLAGRWTEGAAIPILYGGSVKAANAKAILALDGVDGALVGGASLDPAEFIAIFKAGGGA